VVILDDNNKEIERKIQWLNDFTGTKKTFKIVFTAPTNHVKIVYRINIETPIKSECEYYPKSINEVLLDEAPSHLNESFERKDDYILPRSRDLTLDEELILEGKIVWIFARPRSGTTWLGNELLSYGTNVISEPYLGNHLDGRLFEVHNDRADYFFSNRYKETWAYYLRKLILNRIYAQTLDTSKPVIMKEPNGSFGADIILDLLPNSKSILVLRDGRDVIDSQMDARSEDGWGKKDLVIKEEKRIQFIKKQSKLWVQQMEMLMKLYEKNPKELTYLVKYEDLLKNTLTELQKIYKFINVDVNKETLEKLVEKYSFEKIPSLMKGKGKFRRSAIPGKWRENFDEEEKSLINDIMGDALKELGYE